MLHSGYVWVQKVPIVINSHNQLLSIITENCYQNPQPITIDTHRQLMLTAYSYHHSKVPHLD